LKPCFKVLPLGSLVSHKRKVCRVEGALWPLVFTILGQSAGICGKRTHIELHEHNQSVRSRVHPDNTVTASLPADHSWTTRPWGWIGSSLSLLHSCITNYVHSNRYPPG